VPRRSLVPEYSDIQEWYAADNSLNDLQSKVVGKLKHSWFCVTSRLFAYSPGSKSFFQEVFVMIQSPLPPTVFRAETSGRVVFVGKDGNLRKDVYVPRTIPGYAGFRWADQRPLRWCSVRHGNHLYQVYRYSFEMHCEKMTQSKQALQQHLQECLSNLHPGISRQYLEAWWSWKERGAVDASPLKQFRSRIAAYLNLQVEEDRERARLREEERKRVRVQQSQVQRARDEQATAAKQEEALVQKAIELSLAEQAADQAAIQAAQAVPDLVVEEVVEPQQGEFDRFFQGRCQVEAPSDAHEDTVAVPQNALAPISADDLFAPAAPSNVGPTVSPPPLDAGKPNFAIPWPATASWPAGTHSPPSQSPPPPASHSPPAAPPAGWSQAPTFQPPGPPAAAGQDFIDLASLDPSATSAASKKTVLDAFDLVAQPASQPVPQPARQPAPQPTGIDAIFA